MAGLRVYSQPFGFEFRDPSTEEVLMHTNGSTIIVQDKYLQIDLQLPSKRLYGLGERKTNFTLQEGAWTMWASGNGESFDNGTTGSGNQFGVHPFALVQTRTQGEYIGIYFRNTNAQSVVLKFKEEGSTLSYITTGGSLEFYVMMRGSAKEVIKRYHAIIGFPTLAPLWALGW